MTLNRRYLRNFKHNISFYICTSLLTALVVYMYIAISASYNSEADYAHEHIISTMREDGQFSLYKDMAESDISRFEEEYDVIIDKMSYKDCLVTDGSASEKESIALRVFSPSEKLNKYDISSGKDISGDNEIVINELFAKAGKIKIGDTITLSGVSGSKDFKVTGFLLRYDYFFCLKNPMDTFSVSSEFGVAQVNSTALESLSGGDSSGYYSIKYNKNNQYDVREALYNEFMTSDYLSSDTNNRIQTPEDQLDALESTAYMILPISIVFVVLLIAAVLGRKVKNEMKMIGILNALGYRRRELATHYSLFGAIPGLLGGILGVLLGVFATDPIVDMMFESKMEPLPVKYGSSISTSVIAVALPTICYTLAVFCTALVTVRGNAIDMIKGTGKKRKRRSMRLKGMKASFRTKYRLRAVFGNFGRTIIVIIGLTVGGLLLSFCLACVDSLENYVDKSVDQLGDYEYEYFLNTVLLPEGSDIGAMQDSERQIRINKALEGKEYAKVLTAVFAVDGATDNITLMGMDDNPYMVLKDEDGNEIESKDGEFCISSMGAMVYDVEEGDSLTFMDITSLKKYTVKITKIFECGSQNLLVSTNKGVTELLGNIPEGSSNCIMSDKELELSDIDVLKMVSKQSIKDQLDENILQSMKGLLGVVYIFAGAVLVMVVFLMVNILLSENIITVSMLKVLGYHNKEINKVIIHIYHGVALIGFVLGLLAGWWANGANFKASAAVYNCYVDNVMRPSSILIYSAVAIISYAVTMIILGRKSDKISMVESLKDNRE